MSEVKVVERRSDVSTRTRPPFELSEDLAKCAAALGLADNVAQLRDEGYTAVRDIATPEFTARLRETCIRLAEETPGPAKGYAAGMLLGRDPILEEVVLNPKLLTLVEVMCGRGAILSQLVASIRPKGSPELPLHADQNLQAAAFRLFGWLPPLTPEPNP